MFRVEEGRGPPHGWDLQSEEEYGRDRSHESDCDLGSLRVDTDNGRPCRRGRNSRPAGRGRPGPSQRVGTVRRYRTVSLGALTSSTSSAERPTFRYEQRNSTHGRPHTTVSDTTGVTSGHELDAGEVGPLTVLVVHYVQGVGTPSGESLKGQHRNRGGTGLRGQSFIASWGFVSSVTSIDETSKI